MLNDHFSPPNGRWPYFAPDEIEAAVRVLSSGKVNFWTGEECRLFEEEFARYFGCRHAIALSNGTIALELALRALGVGPGDEVIVPCRTFIASASAVVRCGAKPVLADVDAESQNSTVRTITPLLGPATKAIIAVHLAGWPCEMGELIRFARDNNLRVIEDCAQAHGAAIQGRLAGVFGDVAAFSFCQDKIMTTGGEGGMVMTNDATLWEKMWSDKDHGKSPSVLDLQSDGSRFRLLHERFGTNGRMTEMQAAIGRIQLRKLRGWVDQRRRNAAVLTETFSVIAGLRVTLPPEHVTHSYYKYYAFVRPEELRSGWDRDRILTELRQRGIACMTGGCPELYLEKAFIDKGFCSKERMPVAKMLGETSLMFLVHPTLGEREMLRICDAVSEVFGQASGEPA